MRITAEKTKLPVIQGLRGIASFAVCWCHFTAATKIFSNHPLIAASGRNGDLGVIVFFVISGFIIPYTLMDSGYRLKLFPKFMLKRIVRVDPPYLVAIAIAVALGVLSYHSSLFKGTPPHYTAVQMLLHLGYLIPFSHYKWVNVVFWTLAVEFQYYLLLGLLFPVLSSNIRLLRAGSILLWISMPFMVSLPQSLPWYSPLFAMGITSALWRKRVIGGVEFGCYVMASMVACCLKLEMRETVAGILAIVCILWLRWMPVWMLALGDLSYSLYLIHLPVGGRIMNLGARFVPDNLRVLLLLPTVALVLSLAYFLYRFVEVPAKHWASKIKYSHSNRRRGPAIEKAHVVAH